MRKNQNLQIPKGDFRKRFAQRDLEISRNEYNYLMDRYLESASVQEDSEQKKSSNKKESTTEVQSLKTTLTNSLSTSDLYKKVNAKSKDAPEEKKEHLYDITIPSIQSLVEDYSNPYMYDYNTNKFVLVHGDLNTIDSKRRELQSRPSPYGITQQEESYLRATDPKSVLQDTRQLYQINRLYQVDRTLDTISDAISAPAELLGSKVKLYAQDLVDNTLYKHKDYIDDILSTWNISKNNSEYKAYADSNIRLGEKKQFANAIDKYNKNMQLYVLLLLQYDASNNAGERHNLLIAMNNILADNSKLRPAIEAGVTYEYDSSLGKSIMRGVANFINNTLNNEVVNFILPPTAALRGTTQMFIDNTFGKDDVGAQGKRLLDLIDSNEIKPGQSLTEDFLVDFNNISRNISLYNKTFQDFTDKLIEKDKEMALKNKQEAIEWEAWHTPSKEFKAKEKAALENLLTDADTYKYGIWTVLGSSASFNGTQLLSTGLDWLGAGLLMAQHPAAKTAGLASTALGAGLGLLSGTYENRTELTENYIKGLREDLEKEGKLQKFLEDGRKQLNAQNIEIRDDDDIFTHFILKDYKTNDPVIRDLALRHLFGANNAFLNDMMAVSADVAFNAGLNIFGATSNIAEALKIFPEGGTFSILRKVASNPILEKSYRAVKGVTSPNTVATAISPLANIPYNITVKPIFKGIKSAFTPMVTKVAKEMDTLISWAKVAPKAMFNVGTGGKYAIDFLGKTAARGFSESIEEGKQYEYGNLFANGKFAGKSDKLLNILMNDISTGLYTGLSFIGHLFFGMLADKELMSNMRGGFIGGVLNHGTLITGVLNYTKGKGEIAAGDIIFNNVMAEKLRQRSDLINGEAMGKYASHSGYVAMMNAFDRIQKIHDHITNDASERIGLTSEELADQRNMFKRISALSNSLHVIERAKELGIKRGTADFRKFVSVINVADKIQSENILLYNDLVEQAKQILEQDGLSLNVTNLFNIARLNAKTQEQLDLLTLAEDWAKWALPLNNQIMGLYAALNELIQDLQERSEFLTEAERRNLSHYLAQRKKLDDTVKEIREGIGETDNMEFLNYSDPELLDKYGRIYRTLYQASAQLETSTRVLDAVYGKNDSSDLANDFVKEQLDFINDRIDSVNTDKKGAIKASKKSKRNQRAQQILQDYKNSVEDDLEFMAELANRFDETVYGNNKLNGPQEEKQPLEYDNLLEEELNPGAQNLPVSIYDKTLPSGKQFPVGTTITNSEEPDSSFTVTDVKVNPSTGQFLIEAKSSDGTVREIEQDSINQYLKLLPPPGPDYSSELPTKNRVKFDKNSPLAKAFEDAKNKILPAVISREYADYLLNLLGKVIVGDTNDNESQLGTIILLLELNSTVNYLYGNPLYGYIHPNYTFTVPYNKTIQEIYNEFENRKFSRIGIVSKLVKLRDDGKLDQIKLLLEHYNIDPLFNEVLHDISALNSIAELIIDQSKPNAARWLDDYGFYTSQFYPNGTPAQNKVTALLNQNNNVTLYRMAIANGMIADAISVDENGNISIYNFAFVTEPWTELKFNEVIGNQVVSRKEYYNNIADILFHALPEYLLKKVKGIYVIPIARDRLNETNTKVGEPIKLTINTNINRRNILDRIDDYNSTLVAELETFNSLPIPKPRTKPEPESDGSVETKINEIYSYLDQLEQGIAGVRNGSFSFNGMIRSDMRTYLDNSRHVLTKHRSDLKKLSLTDGIKNAIQRIELIYQQIVDILSTYTEGATYNEEDYQYTGETVKSNRAIIPENHALSARSTSGVPITATSDFIVNGKVELMYGWYNSNTGEFIKLNAYSTHPGVGVYAIFTYNGVKYNPVFVQPSHYKNGVQPYTSEGASFVSTIISLQNQSNGMAVVGEAVRLIPNPIYKGTPKPLLLIKALGLTEDDLQQMDGDSDNVGIANVNNDVLHLNRQEDKSFLWRFASTLSGSVFLFHSFNFKEYDDGGQIPVKLIPAKLDKSDIDVIINILKENGLQILNGNRSVMSNKYVLPNGKESPFTNADILRLLTKFELYHNDLSMFYVDDFGNVYFKQRTNDPTPRPIDVNTSEGESVLRELLGNGYEVSQDREILSSSLSNPADKIFGNLKQWISDNGSLNISTNLVFDRDDVNKNGSGFHGIGWAIKHGRLLSNMSSIYNPSISISEPMIDNGTTSHKVEQPAQSKPNHVKPAQPRATWGGLMDTGYDFGRNDGEAFAPYATEELPEEPLDEEDAMEDFKRMLGETAILFKDQILGILKGGLKILGKTYSDLIEISRLAGEGIQFHESFHKILELVVDAKTRERVYKAFTKTHKDVDPTNPRSITEGLAEDFKAWAMNEKHATKWKKIWKRIKEFMQSILNSNRRVLYRMYRNVYKGKYKNIEPSPENIARFNDIFRVGVEERGVLYHEIYNPSTGERINLPNIPSAVDYRAAIDDIVNALITTSGASIFGQSVSSILFTKSHILEIQNGKLYKSFVGEGEPDDVNKIFIDIFDNWNSVLNDVATSLKRFGLHFKYNRSESKLETYKTNLSEEEEKSVENADEGSAKTADINQYELLDYEISKLSKMSEKTKYFFAVIPNVRFVTEYDEGVPMYVNETNANGEEIDSKGRVILTDKETGLRYVETEDGQIITENNLTINKVRNIIPELDQYGFLQFAPFSQTCKIALNKCYQANDLYQLLDLFRKVAIEHPLFVIIANRYASLLNNMKRIDKNGYYITTDGQRYSRMDNGLYQLVIGKDKFGEEYYTADELDFAINRNNQSMAVSIFNNISGTRLHFRSIRSLRPSKTSITFQTADTDNGYSAMRYAQNWYFSFISDIDKVYTKEILENGHKVTAHYAKNKNLFKDVANDLRKLVNAYADRRSTEYKSGEVKIKGKVIRVNRDPEAVKAAYVSLLNLIGIVINVDEFNHLLSQLYNKTDSNALRRYFLQDGEDSVQSSGVSINKFILAIEQGITQDGRFARTITSGSFYSRIGAVTQLADGIWSYNQSLSDLMTNAPGKNKYYQIANRNALDLMLQELNTPNSEMLNNLYKSAYHRGSILIDSLRDGKIVLESYTHAGYESDNKSDFGSDFMLITNAEDIVSKMTPLLEGTIVPPTLSNKKTYLPIRIIDVKTGQPIPLPGIEYIANKNNAQTQNADAEVYSANNIPVLTDKTFDGLIVTKGSYTGKQFELSDDVYDALIKYAFSEYYSIKENIERLKSLPEDLKVYNFDKVEKGGAKNPGAVRFSRFYEIYLPQKVGDSVEYGKPIVFNDDNKSPEENLAVAEMYFFGNNVSQEYRKAIIKEIMSRRLDDNLEYLRKNGIIRYRPNWRKIKDKYSRYEPVAIDTNHLNAIIKAYGNTLLINGPMSARSIATCALILDVITKFQIGMEEYQRLFVGHPGLFISFFRNGRVVDDTQDLSKRLGGHVSTGETLCRLDEVPEKYNCAEFKDYKTTSSQYEDLKKMFDESEARFTLYADAQNKLFIKHQNIKNNIVNVAENAKYYSEGEINLALSILPEEYADMINYLIKKCISAESSEKNGYITHIKSLLYKYKTDEIRQEYDRQKVLSIDDVKKELSGKNLLTGVEVRSAAYSNNFLNKINVADGASFVSPKMVKWMLMSIGKFDRRVEEAWNYLNSLNPNSALDNAIAYKQITDALFGTLKYTATGYRMNGNQPIFYYNKTALFPLFKSMAYGITNDILNQMLKDDVHMLMFESAVKFGGQGKQAFPTTKEGLQSFHFNKYEQDFKWLRKQLNTDPKESELMAIGTQTKKIALTILDIYKDDYVKRNGKIEDGITLRDRIFECERKLATLGYTELLDKFTSTEDMSEYLLNNLSERDASSLMLLGLSLKMNPDTKQLEFNAPIEALSNASWIQSIITSLANKHIIDINLPGNAFIQRSVYAMEDGNILGDASVPSIPKLKISNDWSTMDAVISIDYFYQQFPHLEEMGFSEARDWLIKNNLIGQNAKAETVAYRIPTLANSSIHALRFVDVISTVRDTIVLPEEFTAITGSDFDIDKLFLSTKHFRIDESGNVVTDFDILLNPKEHYGNELLECYLELLSQDKYKYANQLTRSIDFDIEIPKQVVSLLKEGNMKNLGTYDALQFCTQCRIKSENRTGGIGVGPYALNNNNAIMSRLFEVELENKGLIKALDLSRMYGLLDAEGNAVMATIGAFISGHVDIAKDPWVTLLNINEYTYDIHIFLARTGLGLRSLWFCCQPIMRKLADVNILAGGYLFDSNNESVVIRKRKAVAQFEIDYLLGGKDVQDSWYAKMINLAKKNKNNFRVESRNTLTDKLRDVYNAMTNAVYVIQQIFGVDPQNPSVKINTFKTVDGNTHDGTILQDIALHHNREEDIFDPTPRYIISMYSSDENRNLVASDRQMSVKDIQFFVYLSNIMLDDAVSDMKKLVQYSKIETKKQGKNRSEQFAYNEKYSAFFENESTKIMLPETVRDMAWKSSIATKQHLFMLAMSRMLGSLLLQYTSAYESVLREFILDTNTPVTADTMKSALDGFQAYQKYQYIQLYAKINNINLRDLFIGDDSIYNTVTRIVNKILSYPAVYDKYTDGNGRVTNMVLSRLKPSYIPRSAYEDYGEDLPKFVDFLINKEDSSVFANDFESGWLLMLLDNEHPDIQDFARRLIVYAFMTSGDTNKFGSFFNYVPYQWRDFYSTNKLGLTYILYIQSLLYDYDGAVATPDDPIRLSDKKENYDVFIDILRNNWYDDNLVPTIHETSKDQYGNTVNNYYEYTVEDEPLLIALIKTVVDDKGVRHFYDPTTTQHRAVIKIHNYNSNSYKNPQDFKLYKFVRMGAVVNDSNEIVQFPIYGRISQTGGVMYGHTIIQYGDDLNFGWEGETRWFTEERDDKLIDGMYQIESAIGTEVERNKYQLRGGKTSIQELKEDVVRNFLDIPIQGSYEDGTAIDFTITNATLFYNMAKVMGQWNALYGKKPTKGNNALSAIPLPSQVELKHEDNIQQKKIDVYSTNRNKYANLSNVTVRPINITSSIISVINKHFEPSLQDDTSKIIDNITKQFNSDKFNSVELMFQLVKFEAMKQYVRLKALELYNLSRMDIAKSKTREAAAILNIIKAISDIQKEIAESTGSTITSISHKYIPDISGIIDSFFKEKWNEGGPENVENSTAYDIIREIMLQSFLLNPGSTRLLLSTEDAIITHEKGGPFWNTGFPKALMSIRDEIKENYQNIQDVQNTIFTMLGGDEMAYKEITTAVKYAKEGKMFADIEPFFTEEEANQIKQTIPNMGYGRTKGNLIITSASRHTDPVFYATQIINTLRENYNKPFTDPTRINVLEVWSKHDGIPMQNILEACKKYRVAPIVSFSITSLGSSSIEPGVMKYNDLLDNILKLINQGILDPRTTTFRTDPILPGVSKVEDIKNIIERGVKMGIRKFVTSPMQTYDTQVDKNGKSRSVIPFIDSALKKDKNALVKYSGAITIEGTYNWNKYYGLHQNQQKYPGKYAFAPKKEYMLPYVDMFLEMMSKYDILILSCAVPVGNLQPSACLDPEILEAITSIKVNNIIDKTRPFCNCYGVHSDMFRYDDACNSSCSYCYAGQMLTNPFDYYDENGKLKDFAYSKVNEYTEPTDGPIDVIIKDRKYTYDNGRVIDDSGNDVDDITARRVTWKLAVDLNKAHMVNVNGIYYVVTNQGLIFNWGTGKVETLENNIELKKKILESTLKSYEKNNVSTLFNAAELKKLGESRRKFCNRNR